MAAAAHDPRFAKKVGISQSVAREFNDADQRRGMKRKRSPMAEAIGATTHAGRTMSPKCRGMLLALIERWRALGREQAAECADDLEKALNETVVRDNPFPRPPRDAVELEAAEPKHGDAMCGAARNDGVACTRRPHSDGDHILADRVTYQRIIARWPQGGM